MMPRKPWALRAAGRRRLWGSRRRAAGRVLLTAATLFAGASLFAGCAASRNELGTVNSGCYLVIASATGAVHHRGHLRGVRLVTVESLRPDAPRLYDAARARHYRAKDVCLVAFSGTFRSDRVSHPIGQRSGRLAVVEEGYPDRRLLATLLIARLPLSFGHYHF